jgi:hypothetical protein
MSNKIDLNRFEGADKSTRVAMQVVAAIADAIREADRITTADLLSESRISWTSSRFSES